MQSSLPLHASSESPTARLLSTAHPPSLPSDAFSPTHLPEESGTTLDEALQGPGNCHNILEWPIFEGRFSTSELMTSYFDQGNDRTVREGASAGTKGIREEDAPMLVEYFLQHVHIKNPILDPIKVVPTAKNVAEDGFKWDGTSCLILIICALANLAEPFSILKPAPAESSGQNAEHYRDAEAYYTAARKRMGLLENSVLAVQCTFLLGVYQMYSMRPLRAWMSFNQACAIFQTYLHTRCRQEANRDTKRLEQRLYWSCLKSECEMRDEIDLPPSGLAKVNHPDVFPSPPGGTPDPDGSDDAIHSESRRLHRQPDVEKIWYYYLSEIASRRLKNRISTVLHSGSPLSWQLSSLPKLYRLAEELERQVQRWAEHMPACLEDMNEDTTDELTYMLMARFLDMQELICRPFLYLVIHSEHSSQHSSTTLAYAQRGLDLVFRLLRRLTIKHRHHGSWYGARQQFTHSLLLLAAVRSQQISIPDGWESTLELVLNCLSYWQSEAPDLGVARQILLSVQDYAT